MALVEDGTLLGSRQLDMGNSGYYVLTGTAKMRVGDEERIVGKGAWVYTPPGLEHYTENVGDDDLAYLLFGGNPTTPGAHDLIENVPYTED